MMRLVWIGFAAWLAFPGTALAAEREGASGRSGFLELKMGSLKPRLGDEPGLERDPYADLFGDASMLKFELELERQLFQAFGTAAIGFSVGYAEQYGRATLVATGDDAGESAGLRILPLRLLGIYRFDYLAQTFNVPLVPYVKAGLVYTPWWMVKGGETETFNGRKASGGKAGYVGVAGLAFQLDFLDPQLARDFDASMGVNHSYVFVEYMREEVDNFGGPGLHLSSRHLMFGLGLEY